METIEYVVVDSFEQMKEEHTKRVGALIGGWIQLDDGSLSVAFVWPKEEKEQ